MTDKALLLKKFGSEEAISAHYREMQKKSMLNPNKQKGRHKGGFNYLTKEQRHEMAKAGAKARWQTGNIKSNQD